MATDILWINGLSFANTNPQHQQNKCSRVMNHSTTGLVASNHNVTSDIDFGIDKDVTLIEDNREYNPVVFDVLKVSADEIAQQLTLIDLPLFQHIEPEELTSCSWTSKRKHDNCPNIVKATKRFNQVSYWVTREILDTNTAKGRAERIAYFIKVAKKLQELNNLNCLKAVVSGLQCTPIYRLNKTWNVVPKRDKEKLEKLNELVCEENNSSKLRLHLQTTKLPCIPYLGMYLTDLTYINTIHPPTGGLDVERTNKMNEILRIIADYQQSLYDFKPIYAVQNYLNSVKYIDELQKFMEDENYKLSCQIEPTELQTRAERNGSTGKRETVSESDDTYRLYPKQPASKSNSLNPRRTGSSINPKSASLNLPSTPFNQHRSPSPNRKDFVPGHRKVKSLGSTQIFLQSISGMNPSSTSISSGSNVSTGSRYNLVDDSILEDNLNTDIRSSTSYDSGLDHDEPETHPIIRSNYISEDTKPEFYFKLQGFLKRKTLKRNATSPKVANWQRYWVGITCSHLVYFLPKYRAFGGHDRNNFKENAEKILPLFGSDVCECNEEGSFQLTDESGANVYRFRAGTNLNRKLWMDFIKEASNGGMKEPPQNLITFDDDDTHL
ncbi:ras-specific guanine nucleotide-releasing factor RalGPS2-like isoform X3 [Clytia hemisphaerica]|uniref:ras-specific guanine nucleotide-releasing factor RalGPS2-like isoform X3 n=1 Tax=Clytia hemisphaerica TaxID=252671 RepID=UPI0034D73470